MSTTEKEKNLFAASKACGKIGKVAICAGAGITLVGYICALLVDVNRKKQLNNRR